MRQKAQNRAFASPILALLRFNARNSRKLAHEIIKFHVIYCAARMKKVNKTALLFSFFILAAQ